MRRRHPEDQTNNQALPATQNAATNYTDHRYQPKLYAIC